MTSPFEKQAASFLQGDGGKKVQAKSAWLEALAQSPDGQKIKAALERDGRLEDAIASGDTPALQSVLSEILQTREGQRLAKKLQDFMK